MCSNHSLFTTLKIYWLLGLLCSPQLIDDLVTSGWDYDGIREEKCTTYGDCGFQHKQHLKEPVILPVDKVNQDVFELPPCCKVMIVFMFVLMDHIRQKYPWDCIYSKMAAMAWRIEYLHYHSRERSRELDGWETRIADTSWRCLRQLAPMVSQTMTNISFSLNMPYSTD